MRILIYISTALVLVSVSLNLNAQSDISGLIIPNVITPNGDGLNDRFEILTSSGQAFPIEDAPSLIVYNRNGTIVFEASKYVNQWDASDLIDSQYFFSMHFKTGEAFNGHIRVYR